MKKFKALKVSVIITIIFAIFLFNACAPLREFGKTPTFQKANNFNYTLPGYDSTKKTIVIVANNDGTELFDMMAPYYLFNATQQANVYIIAKKKYPIVIKKGLFILPQMTFREVDSLHIKPDAIVIPFLGVADSASQDPEILFWIKKSFSVNVNLLTVCDGASTGAATGLFDGKQITSHASDFEGIKKYFSKPVWIQNTSVVQSDNLYSSGGVSNATEGSLVVIRKMFGEDVMRKVMKNVEYPYASPKTQHQSNAFQSVDKMSAGKKIIFGKNKKVGILLENGINEFMLAGITDTYNRTFPKTIETFSIDNRPVVSKYGLTLIPTGIVGDHKLDELHILESTNISSAQHFSLKAKNVITYDVPQKRYIIDRCLERISNEYGSKFGHVVKLMLDYN